MSTTRYSTNEISEVTLGLTESDRQRNTAARENLKAEHIVDGIQSYQKNGYMLHGRSTHQYTGRHWNTNQKANAT
jgi:hypothetical protein